VAQESLGTKDKREANLRAKPVLMEFDRILARAEALLSQTPLRSTLSRVEVERMAETHYAALLAEDDKVVVFLGPTAFPKEEYLAQTEGETFVLAVLDDAQEALATGDVAYVAKDVDALLEQFHINLDRRSAAYAELGTAVLRANVKGILAIEARNHGEPIDTPHAPARPVAPLALKGATLRAALEAWKKGRARRKRTEHEFGRSVEMIIELHGDLPITDIKRSHVREYREALQHVPRKRKGKLLGATLPQLAEHGRRHPDEAKISAATINKQLGACQAVALFARDNGIIPDDVPWADPFANMRLEEDDVMLDLMPPVGAAGRLLGARGERGRDEAGGEGTHGCNETLARADSVTWRRGQC
jgi:hypothetical protein